MIFPNSEDKSNALPFVNEENGFTIAKIKGQGEKELVTFYTLKLSLHVSTDRH